MSIKRLNSRLPNKRAYITGAGSGLGAEFTKILQENGWTLYLSDVNSTSLEAYKDVPNIYTYVLDVSDKQAYQKQVEVIASQTDGIDLLINNAGIGDGEFFEDYQIENWEKMVQINLMGTLYGTKLFLPLLKKPSSSLVINIGSMAGFMNAPAMSAYNATKAALYSLSDTLRHEFKPYNIQVSIATPTFFKTNIMSQAQGNAKLVGFAEREMSNSSASAREMAEVILSKAAGGKFLIIHPKKARQRYFLKRWFPGLVNRLFERLLKGLGSEGQEETRRAEKTQSTPEEILDY